MEYPQNSRPVDADYALYGPRVEIGEVQINLDDVEPLRRFVAQDFFRALGRHATVLDESYDITRGGRRISGFGPYEPNVPDTFVGASLRHDLDDSWRMIIMRTAFCDARREDKKIVRHFFQVIGGNVLIAKKEVRIKRGTVSLEVDSIDGITETITSSRKMYEKPVDAHDCQKIQETLNHTISHLQVLDK